VVTLNSGAVTPVTNAAMSLLQMTAIG